MTPANDSSSSATAPDPAAGAYARLPEVAAALLRGDHRDLLAPLRFLAPGALPEGVPPPADRRVLARALAAANAAYGHPAAEQLASRLADPATHVVVTGQQPGLFGGPLLTLAKMAAAVRWAERLEAAGMPAVAVFWVATEDHDWKEVTHVALHGKEGVVQLDLGDDPSPLAPVGMRSFGDRLEGVLEQARGLYPGDAAAGRWHQIATWYRPHARFGEAFCRFLVALFGVRSPLMLDAMDSGVKQLQAPYLHRLIEQRSALLSAQAAAHEAVAARGLPLQVTPQEEASPLFLLRGQERRRVLWDGDDRWRLRGSDEASQPVAALLAIARDNPAVISPGVLARPALQDALLGTTLQILGPSEMSYMPQAAAAYRVLELPGPWTTLRPRTLVLEGRQREHLEALGVRVDELVGADPERLIAERMGDDPVTPARQRIAEIMAGLEAPIADLDPTLERPREKAASMADRALDQLAGKVAAALARRHETWHRRLVQVQAAVLPAGVPQERSLAVAHFAVRYGDALVAAYLEQLELDPRTVHIVTL